MRYSEFSQATNNLGRPIARSAEELKNFWQWFGKSKLIDQQGRPIVLYHGTKADFKSFDSGKSNSNTGTGVPPGTFVFTNSCDVAQSYAGQKTKEWGFATEEEREEWRRLCLSDEPDDINARLDFHKKHAIQDVKTFDDGGNVMMVYLRMLRPLRVNAHGEHWYSIYFEKDEWTSNELMAVAKERGYDGLIVRNVEDRQEGQGKPADIFAVFSPNQIKSAITNTGAFYPESEHIDEGFAPAVKWRWMEQKDFEFWAKFKIEKVFYTVSCFRINTAQDKWTLSFRAETKKQDFGYQVSNTGNAWKVFGTVVAIARRFIAIKKPKVLQIDSDPTERSRLAVNRRVAAAIADGTPYIVLVNDENEILIQRENGAHPDEII